MNLSEYIRDLLIFHEMINLPGLGTFRIIRESAVLTDAGISPPGSSVIFSPEFQTDDNTLAQKIAEAEEIPLEDAIKMVTGFISEARDTLQKGDMVHMEGFGTLQKDINDNYLFIINEEIILDYETVGFESFELEPIDEIHDITNQEITPGETPANNQKEVPGEIAGSGRITAQDIIQTPSSENDLITEKSSNRNFLWLLTGSVVIILCSLIILTLTTDLTDNLDTILFRKPKIAEPALPVPVFPGIDDYEKKMDETIDSLTKLENALRMEENLPLRDIYSEYHIIAGSFSVTGNADDLQRELSLMGYPSVIIDRGDGFYRVSALSFTNKESALSGLETFKNNTPFKSAWLLGLN